MVACQKNQARLAGAAMNADNAENTGTTAIRPGYSFDLAALDRWMTDNVPDYAGPLKAEQFKGGQSNPTYRLTTPRGTYVLRRKPPGKLLAGAHAIEREARIMTGLAKAGFPVPHIYGLCEDTDIIGTAFYVMEMVEGRIFWDASFPGMNRAERAAHFDAMNATIAQLHSIDPAAIGLADYGRTGNYFARQVARWSRQYQEDELAGRDPNMDQLVEWLSANIPETDETTLVHGDFRCDNMIFHPKEPRVIAVLDWELSTLGHPLADFAYHAMMYHMPPHIVAGLGKADIASLGIPSEDEYIATYYKRRGLADSITNRGDYHFALIFSLFRLAAIFHGIKGRALRGTASSAQAHERARVFPEIAALGVAQIRK